MEGLREELQDVRRNHKQQLTELASLHEEERRRAVLDKETSLDQLRSDMERIRSDLERSHQQEKNATLEKVSVDQRWGSKKRHKYPINFKILLLLGTSTKQLWVKAHSISH